MKRILVALAISFLLLAFSAPAAFAQGVLSESALACCEGKSHDGCDHNRINAVGSGCSGQRGGADRRDETASPWGRAAPVETISGLVIEVYQTPEKLDQTAGSHILLRTNRDMLDVHLGPEWYVDQQNFKIEPGDVLDIKGEPFTKDGTPALIAFEVKQGNNILILRDEEGLPLWRRSPS